LLFVITALVGVVATLDTARTATAEWRVEGELNVRLGLHAHHERWHVHDLATDTDVTLTDQHTGVVDGLGESTLEDESLEATLHEVLNGERQDVIQTLLVLLEDSVADHAAHEGLTFEDTLWVLLVLGEEHAGSGANLGENQAHTPDFLLVLETILTDDLKLGVETLLLERTTWGPRVLGEITELGTSHFPDQKLQETSIQQG